MSDESDMSDPSIVKFFSKNLVERKIVHTFAVY